MNSLSSHLQLYSVPAIRRLEEYALHTLGVPESTLMQRAGAAALQHLRQRWPKARRIWVICGKGNNGGDGYVLARLAAEQGLLVQVRYLLEIEELPQAAQEAALACEKAGVVLRPLVADEALVADVVVDGLLGIGVKGEVSGMYAAAIAKINASGLPVLALDVPSGIDADTGAACGVALRAALTVTFIGLKRGLLTGDARACCGDVVVADLELPVAAYQAVEAQADWLQPEALAKSLLPRQRTAHKGDFGHVLVIGGNYGMAGAARLAGEAALRVGSGLVTVATRRQHISAVSGECPELLCYGVEQAGDLQPLLQRASVVVLGPGLGQDAWAQGLLVETMQAKQPKVIDADGLNLLAKHEKIDSNWVLTPHPGEAARLLASVSARAVNQDRFAAAKNIQHRYGGVCVLKGAGTIIQSGAQTAVCTAGNPGMASGGMGDVLSGVIAGLLAQGLENAAAAQLGVLAHALAADDAARAGGERGLVASDLLPYLRQWVNPNGH